MEKRFLVETYNKYEVKIAGSRLGELELVNKYHPSLLDSFNQLSQLTCCKLQYKHGYSLITDTHKGE